MEVNVLPLSIANMYAYSQSLRVNMLLEELKQIRAISNRTIQKRSVAVTS